MIHRLTLGHFDPSAIRDRVMDLKRPLDMPVVSRLLAELGDVDDRGCWTLDGEGVRFHDGTIVIPWQGGWINRVAEEFALRLNRETGCLIADREHGRVIDPGKLMGMAEKETATG